MTIIPPYLEPGDTIAIAAPARHVTEEQLMAAVEYMRAKGFKVLIPEGLFEIENQFGGSDAHRSKLFNGLLADKNVRAIWCARGAYGCVRMVDGIDFDLLKNDPKWLIGFSDFSTILSHARAQCNMAGLHASMPIFMYNKSDHELDEVKLALDSIADALQGKHRRFDLRGNETHNPTEFEGEICGGNLSVLLSIIGSSSEVDWSGKILFLEDLDEYYYHIDRIVMMMKRAGKLKGLKALLVGKFIQMHDHEVPFGYDEKEIILQHCQSYGYPIIFDVNAGHQLQNMAIPFGVLAKFKDGILTFADL